MKKSTKILLGITGGLAVLFTAGVLMLFSFMDGQAKAEYYDFGTDRVASIYTVVGERRLSGISVSINPGQTVKSLRYKSDSSAQDLQLYAAYLTESEGFLPDGDGGGGRREYVKPSAEPGHRLTLSLQEHRAGYTVTVIKERE